MSNDTDPNDSPDRERDAPEPDRNGQGEERPRDRDRRNANVPSEDADETIDDLVDDDGLGSDVEVEGDVEIDEDAEDSLLVGLQISSSADIEVPDRRVDQVIDSSIR